MTDHELPGGSGPAGGLSAPSEGLTPQNQGWAIPVNTTPPKPGFSASRKEIIAALASYFLAWWYLWNTDLFLGPWDENTPLWFWTLLFVLGFVGLTS